MDFSLAALILILCAVAPLLLAYFLIWNKNRIGEEEFIGAYGFLVKDFKEKVFCVFFHVIFLARRLTLIVSVHVFHEFPITQMILISASCWIVISIQVFIHILITRPFKDGVLNVIFIFIELAISICYSTAGLLLDPDADQEVLMWTNLGCIYSSYLLHSIIGYYKLFKIVYPKIKEWCCKKESHEIITEPTLTETNRSEVCNHET